ncbi:uncharacterized protein METZ01_LOCUS394716 [marine metagenome]|uniref:Uncharacterized protein n=1 Tax=marine metagenome TaxID=408172 RepID=A0A382V5T7_9ZZZZ
MHIVNAEFVVILAKKNVLKMNVSVAVIFI